MASSIYKVQFQLRAPISHRAEWELGSRVLDGEPLRVAEDPEDVFPHLVRSYPLCGILEGDLERVPVDKHLLTWPNLPTFEEYHKHPVVPGAKGLFLGSSSSGELPSFEDVKNQLHEFDLGYNRLLRFHICIGIVTEHFGMYSAAINRLYTSLSEEEQRILRRVFSWHRG